MIFISFNDNVISIFILFEFLFFSCLLKNLNIFANGKLACERIVDSPGLLLFSTDSFFPC